MEWISPATLTFGSRRSEMSFVRDCCHPPRVCGLMTNSTPGKLATTRTTSPTSSQNVEKLLFLRNITTFSRLSERVSGEGGIRVFNFASHSSQYRGEPSTASFWLSINGRKRTEHNSFGKIGR